MSIVSNTPLPFIGSALRRDDNARRINSYLSRTRPVANKRAARQQVGIVIRRFEQPFYSKLLDSTVKQLSLLGMDAMVKASHGTAEGEANAVDALVNSGCHGIILHSELLSDTDLLGLVTTHQNTVILGRQLPTMKNRCIYSDNQQGGALAARCLVNAGHRRIAMVTGPAYRTDTLERSTGFLKELQRHNIDIPLHLIFPSNFHYSGGIASMNQLMHHRNEFSAVFFQNDAMAIGALSVCHANGVTVPSELSMIGYDDLALTAICRPQLTSIHIPLLEWGKNAARLMKDLIGNNAHPTEPDLNEQEYRPYLVQRDTIRDLHAEAEGHSGDDRPACLSEREVHCLEWSARGKTSWEMSKILGVSESTVVFHLRNSMAKLNAANRTQAVAIAISKSLISIN